MRPSSQDLHPKAGARFVFERLAEDPPRYSVAIYLPEGRGWTGSLSWPDARAHLEGEARAGDSIPSDELDWARAEALKLARVLHRDPRPRLTRWRG